MRFLILGIIMVLFFSACGGPKQDPTIPGDQVLYERAMNLYGEESYEEALTVFEQLLHEHPTSHYAANAELRSGDCYFQREKYVEAAETFKNFVKLHPAHVQLDYAYFKAGESYFHLAPSAIDRDLGHAASSLDNFSKLRECCPQSSFLEQAEPMARENLSKLARRILYIGDFYAKRDQPKDALNRYRQVLREYPGLGLEEETGWKIGQCLQQLGERRELVEHVKVFSEQHPASPYRQRLEAMLGPR